MNNIGVIGLGKLGLPVASVFAEQEHNKVVGLEINKDYLKFLNKQTFITPEPDINLASVMYTSDYNFLVKYTDIAFVCVNTPILDNGDMDFSQLNSVVEDLRLALVCYPKQQYTVVILSTLMPYMARTFKNSLTLPGVTTIAMPVWIAMGTVVKDFKNPPSLVIGSDKEGVSPEVVELLSLLVGTDIQFKSSSVITTTYETAALIKLAHNAWCTTKMAFTTELGQLDGYDKFAIESFFRNGGDRPGSFWKFGPPFGGPCFPRDLSFFNQVTNSNLGRTVERINEDKINSIAITIFSKAKMGSRIAIWGTSYKYGTQTEEASISIKLFNKLSRQFEVFLLDDNVPSRLGTDFSNKYLTDKAIDIHIVTQEEYLKRLENIDGQVINLWSKE